MADNQIIISNLVPLNVVDRDRTLPNIYNTRHFDGWMSDEQLLEYEQGKRYAQKWQMDDFINIQLKASYDPVNLKVIDRTGAEKINLQLQPVASIGSTIYLEASVALDTLDEGYYLVVILGGDPVQKILDAEVIHVKAKHEGTILIKYSNSFNNNILWETGIEFFFRVDGVVKYDRTKSTRTVYIDQPANVKTVKGMSSRVFNLIIGNIRGVPDWQPDKLVEIFDQTHVEIDGKGFSAFPNSELKAKRIERYAWAQWDMEIGETLNRREKIFNSNGIVDENVVIDYITEGALFGPVDGDANDNTYKIIKYG